MVKKIGKFFAYFVFFLVALVFFSPKEALYHQLEQKIKSFGIVVSQETLSDNGFSFEIDNAQIFVKKIPSVNIEYFKLSLFGLYNGVEVQKVELAKALKSFAPTKIEFIEVNHSILNPLHIMANAKGEFGDAKVDVDILERKLILHLQPSKLMFKNYKSTLRNLKKLKPGGYLYEQAL